MVSGQPKLCTENLWIFMEKVNNIPPLFYGGKTRSKNLKQISTPIRKHTVSDATAALYSFLAPACSLKWTSSHLYPFKCPPISHTCKDSWTKWQYAPFYPAHPWPSAITFFSSKSSTPHLYGGTPGQWWPTDTAPFKIFSFQELLHSSSITD